MDDQSLDTQPKYKFSTNVLYLTVKPHNSFPETEMHVFAFY